MWHPAGADVSPSGWLGAGAALALCVGQGFTAGCWEPITALPCPQPHALQRLTRLVLCSQEPGVFVVCTAEPQQEQ